MVKLLIPNGLVDISVPFKYSLQDLLQQEGDFYDTFISLLQLPSGKNKRYFVLYTLAINNLLVDKLSNQERRILQYLDEVDLPISSSQLYTLLLNARADPEISPLLSFEASFHLSPNKFILPIQEKIDNPFELRAQILNKIFSNFILSPATLQNMYEQIDSLYFENLLSYRLLAAHKSLEFRVSTKMIRTAGSMTTKPDKYVIAISERIHQVLDQKKIGLGIVCNGAIDCILVTLQHELVHLIVALEKERLKIPDERTGIYSSHGVLFSGIAENFFGLTERTHRFFEEETVKEELPVFSLNDNISFKIKGKSTSGVIIKCNPKRAQVRISSGAVYNVPYEILEK